jgi:hypothetical protein
MQLNAQNIAINETNNQPDESAILDISSNTKGLLIPRMTQMQRLAIGAPAKGLLLYQTDTDSSGFYYYGGAEWLWLPGNASKSSWRITGNGATDSAIHFLGTTDNQPIMLRQNNLPMGQLNSKMHNFFIGGGSGENNVGQMNTGYGDSTLSRNSTGYANTAIGYRALAGGAEITGIANVAVGPNTLPAATSASNNVAIGSSAQGSLIKGTANIAIGTQTLRNADSTSYNIAIGQQTLFTTKESFNTAVGYQALAFANRKYNTAIGYQTGYFNNYLQTNPEFGIENTYLGHGAGFYANTGSKNVVIGHRAMVGSGYYNADVPANDGYKRNVAIGDSAMHFNIGSDNIAVGFQALTHNVEGTRHVAIGAQALFRTNAPYPNTAIGYNSQDSNRIGGANTSVGSYTLTKNKEGYNNTAIGNAAMYEAENLSTPSALKNNTAVGNDALRLVKYSGETAIGAGALRNDTGSVLNTAVGFYAMYQHRKGNNNTAVGTSSLELDEEGIQNTAIGVNAMYSRKRGENNTAIGYAALTNDSIGVGNTAVGTGSLNSNKSGSYNTAIGLDANTNTDNLINATAIGARAMVGQSNSLVLGSINGINNAIADTKVGIGTITPDSLFSIANKVSIGNSGSIQFDNNVSVMQYLFKSGSFNAARMIFAHSPSYSNWGMQYHDATDRINFVNAGSPVTTIDLAAGRVGIGVASPSYQLQLSTDQAAKLTTSTWTTTSDIRLKKVDGTYTRGLQEILQLQPIRYHYAAGNARNLATDVQAYGFSAQAVQVLFPEAVTQEADGYLSLNIHPILIAYTNAIKEQQQQISELQQQLNQAKADQQSIQQLLQRVAQLENKSAKAQ